MELPKHMCEKHRGYLLEQLSAIPLQMDGWMDILGGISEILAMAHPSKAQLEDGRVWFKCAGDRILLLEDECEVAP